MGFSSARRKSSYRHIKAWDRLDSGGIANRGSSGRQGMPVIGNMLPLALAVAVVELLHVAHSMFPM